MPCSRSPGGVGVGGSFIPACLAGFQANTQGGSLGGSGGGVYRPTPKGEVEGGSSPGPQPRGKLRGIWSRLTPKGEVEGDLAGGGGCLYCLGWYASYWNAFLVFLFFYYFVQFF